jgi:flagellar biosynthesis protein FlhB
MSDADKSSKTEMPTGKRLQELFNKGQFPRVPEVGVVFVLIASFSMLSFWAPQMAHQLTSFSSYIFAHLHQFDISVTSISYFLPEILKASFGMILPFIIVCMIAGVLAGGLQTGFKITPEVLGIHFDKLNFINGLQGLFSPQKFITFGIELLKFIVVAWVIWGVLLDIQRDPIFYTTVPVDHIVAFIYQTFLAILWKLIIALGIIAALNYAFQHWRHIEDNKMTKQEVADEMKNAEGNAQIKGARRRRARQIAYREILAKVPLADVVVTNPTHFAIALRYERGKDAAPIVLAKGKDLIAQRIKQIARKHGVPMVENRPVARALYKLAQPGQIIPAPLYQAVAQILAYVYRAHRYYFHRLKARRMEARA